ncbi:unnamed protein product [Heterotrigona itama]|uniref:Salivary secreted peptide n=1 Tax=Heterotrigona itama TaxID=395501 RepID=A0A6V7HJ71_9HYME|nr:unnamed protein product [Heterotrigona itama]
MIKILSAEHTMYQHECQYLFVGVSNSPYYVYEIHTSDSIIKTRVNRLLMIQYLSSRLPSTLSLQKAIQSRSSRNSYESFTNLSDMVMGKVIVFLAIVAVAAIFTEVSSVPQVALYANNSNKSHNLIIGYRMPGDRLVVRSRVVKNSSWMQIVTDTKTFNTTRWDRITLVQALDQKTNGNGAYASILNGGPGHQNVTIRFKSQRSHGIDFIVELYARP